MSTPLPAIREHWLIFLLALVQFINIVDFMMVMPLAPDFARSLGFPTSSLGLVASAYSVSSAIAGFIAALFVDQFSRKRSLMFCLAILSVTTMACTLAWDLNSMVAARFLAGIAGGPIFGICGAFIADYVPAARRGHAMGKLMGAFSAASVLGVPFGLELAHLGTWKTPFYAISAFGFLTLIIAVWKLPYHKPLVDTQSIGKRIAAIGRMLASPIVLASFGCSAVGMLAGFLLIPNIAAFVQLNLGYPREQLGVLYLAGGACTFFSQRWAGWLVDKTSATFVSIVFGALFITNIYQGFVLAWAAMPVVITFVVFMVTMSGRGVAAQTLASKVPSPQQRGAFMAVQGSVINVATSFGAYASAQILSSDADGKLLNMDKVGLIAIVISLFVPLIFWYVEKRVRLQPN